jgi:hypothetical protein
MSTDRNANGRFATGWRGGPGRPRRAIEAEYLVALSETVPLDAWRAVCQIALDQARNGDAKAREWLSSYLIGKPLQAVPLPAPARPGIDLLTMMKVVLDALEPLPNFGEIRQRLGQAFRPPKESTRDSLARSECGDLNQVVGGPRPLPHE